MLMVDIPMYIRTLNDRLTKAAEDAQRQQDDLRAQAAAQSSAAAQRLQDAQADVVAGQQQLAAAQRDQVTQREADAAQAARTLAAVDGQRRDLEVQVREAVRKLQDQETAHSEALALARTEAEAARNAARHAQDQTERIRDRLDGAEHSLATTRREFDARVAEHEEITRELHQLQAKHRETLDQENKTAYAQPNTM